MKFDFNKTMSKFLNSLLSPKATPYFTLFMVIVFGIIITLTTFFYPSSAYIFIAFISLIITITIAFLVIVDRRTHSKRLSDIAGIANYDYDTKSVTLTWKIFDGSGKNALLVKEKDIVALESISHIKDYGWGDGKVPETKDINVYPHECIDIDRQGSKYLILIKLDREYIKGSEIKINYQKKITDAFLQDKEWVESNVTTNTKIITLRVIFPKDRPFKYAEAIHRHGDYIKPVSLAEDGFTEFRTEDNLNGLNWEITEPVLRDTYIITWQW